MSAQSRLSALVERAEKRPRAPLQLVVGAGGGGRARGALDLLAALRQQVAARSLKADVVNGACAGLCYAQVTVGVERADGSRMIFGDLTPGSATALLDAISGRDVSSLRPLAVWPHAEADHFAGPGAPFLAGQTRLITRDLGQIDPESIDSYLTRGGYATLARALDSASPEDAIAEVKASGLIGRGGAYFPT